MDSNSFRYWGKDIVRELFYWSWLPLHYISGPIYRLRKSSKIRWLTRTLENRKDCNVHIGKDFNLFPDANVLVHPNSTLFIGNNVTISERSKIGAKHGGKLYLGNNSHIGGYCFISAWHEIIIEDNVLFSNMIWVTDHQHKFDLKSKVDFSYCDNLKPIRIKSGTFIGNKVTIMQGVTIGRNCVIGANSVVTKNIPDGCVAGGVPEKIIRTE